VSALADATFIGKKSATINSRLPSSSTIGQLYSDGILKLEVLGLQCVDFDRNVYHALKERYEKLAEVAQYPEDTNLDRPTKKQRID